MTATELLLILGMAVAVYLPKAIPLVLVSETVTSRLRPWLHYVAPAVLGALVAPSIIAPAGQVAAPGWDHYGFVVALLVALRTRRMLPSLAAGMVVVVIAALAPH